MKHFIICRGIQGSGKSTFSIDWACQDPEHRVRISRDDLRDMLGEYWIPSREPLVRSLQLSSIQAALKNNYDIILDDMNLDQDDVAEIIGMIHEYNSGSYLTEDTYEIEYRDFKVPLEECIKRDKERGTKIGEHIIRSTYDKYKWFYSE